MVAAELGDCIPTCATECINMDAYSKDDYKDVSSV